MKIALFYHSLVSDWNHGNAHFLRGIVRELSHRGHQVEVYEPQDGWSLQNMLIERPDAIAQFQAAYPGLESIFYDLNSLDLDRALEGAQLVIVHEWNDCELVKKIGQHRDRIGGYRLLFHDTHHRCVSDRNAMAAYDLSHYDGVLAYGQIIRDIYLKENWIQRAWTWHEAADIRVFHPLLEVEPIGDLVWIGNWGDEERTEELYQFLLEPVKDFGLKTRVHGVRYPQDAVAALQAAGIDYAGWLPNAEVPQVFAQYRVTIHVPRRFYVKVLPGIPTIRVFEALACGIPLICSPWEDAEGLFRPGQDYLIARTGEEMQQHLKTILQDRELAQELVKNGLEIIHSRHTCAHRVDELLAIYRELESAREI